MGLTPLWPRVTAITMCYYYSMAELRNRAMSLIRIILLKESLSRIRWRI